MSKIALSRPTAITLQLVGAWVVGSVVLPIVLMATVALLFVGGLFALILVGLVGLAACYALLVWVISTSPDVSRLGASRSSRCLWAAIVLGLGTASWVLAWGLIERAGLGVSGSTPLLGGIPFALAAGLFLRGADRSGRGLRDRT
jgi:hypothetical protein